MRLKREMIWVLFKTADAGVAPTIEALFASPEAMARYFVNHDLAKKHRLGSDGEVYPKFTSKQFKFYSLEEVEAKKRKTAGERLIEEAEKEETQEVEGDDMLDLGESPPIDSEDK